MNSTSDTFHSEAVQSYVKGLMWDYDMTKKEALAYYFVVVTGMTRQSYAETLNVSVSLITKRVKSAQAKINAP